MHPMLARSTITYFDPFNCQSIFDNTRRRRVIGITGRVGRPAGSREIITSLYERIFSQPRDVIMTSSTCMGDDVTGTDLSK